MVVTPHIGMGCTLAVGSDRYPATVIEVGNREMVIQQDQAIVAERYDQSNPEYPTYVFVKNELGPTMTFTWRPKFGRWVRKGERGRKPIYRLTLGVRDHYLDPHF